MRLSFVAAFLASVSPLAVAQAETTHYFRMQRGQDAQPAAQPTPPPPETSSNDAGAGPPGLGGNNAPSEPARQMALDYDPPAGDPSYGDPASGGFRTSNSDGTPTFAVTAGALPTGIDIDASGALTGSFFQTGSFTFTVTATDATSSASRQASIEVRPAAPAIAVSYPSSRRIAGLAFSGTAHATNDANVVSWTLRDAPPWLQLGSTSGALSGTSPQGADSLSYGIVGADAFGRQAFLAQDVPFEQPTLTASFPSTATVGDLVAGTLATNLPAPAFSLSGQPSWLAVDGAGRIAGTVPQDAASAYSIVAGAIQEQASATVPVPFGVTAVTVGVDGNHDALVGSQDITGTAVASSASGWTFSLANAPGWVSIDPASGALSGTAPDADLDSPGVRAVATRNGVSVPSDPFSVRVGRTAVTLAPSTLAALQEGAGASLSASTNMPGATWSIAGAPAGSRVGPDGSVTIHGSDVDAPTDYPAVVTATNGKATATAPLPIRIEPATASLASGQARSGAPFSLALSTTMAAAGGWSASSETPVSGLAAGDPSARTTTLGGAGPATPTANDPVAVSVEARYTAATAPTGAVPAQARAASTLTVYPALVASSPPAQSGSVGNDLTVPAPSVTGKVGTLAYALLQGGTDVSSTVGGICQGLSFDRPTGVLSGVPSSACTASFGYRVTDDGGAYPSVATSTVTGVPFDLTVAAGSITATPSPVEVTEGDAVSLAATTSVANPAWSMTGNPAWFAMSASGGSYMSSSVSPDVPDGSPSTSTVRLSAARGGATVTRDVAVRVNPATVTLGTIPDVRSGNPFSGTVSGTMTAPGSWSVGEESSDENGWYRTSSVGSLAVNATSLSGVAPSNPTAQNTTRRLTVTRTAATAPTSGARASAASSTILTVWPDLVVVFPGNRSFAAGSTVSVTPIVNYASAAANLTYALMQGSTDISDTVADACAGLTFSRSSGAIGGTPSTTCNLTLAYKATDSGGSNTGLAGTRTSQAFTLATSAPTMTLGVGSNATQTSATDANFVEGLYQSMQVTTNVASPTWTVSGLPAGLSWAKNSQGITITGYPGDATQDTAYPVSIQLSKNGVSLAKTFNLTVRAASVAFAQTRLSVRSQTYSYLAYTAPAGGQSWAISGSPLDTPGLAAGTASQTSGNVAGPFPAYASTTGYTETTVTATLSMAGNAKAAGSFVARIYPRLILTSQTGDKTYSVGNTVSLPAPSVTGLLGSPTWTMSNSTGGANIGTSFSTTCPGLSFNASSGAISGKPTASCNVGYYLTLTDPGTDGLPSANVGTNNYKIVVN